MYESEYYFDYVSYIYICIFFPLGIESGNGDKGEEVMKLNDQIQVIRKELTESQHMISRLTDERSGLQLQLRQLEVCLHLFVNEL